MSYNLYYALFVIYPAGEWPRQGGGGLTPQLHPRPKNDNVDLKNFPETKKSYLRVMMRRMTML